MSAADHEHADIDASIARGEWWLRLFNALARQGERRREALTGSRGGRVRGFSRALDRAARGMRLALIAVLRLEQILAALVALRLRSGADIAALRARALARAKARDQAEVRRTTSGDEDEDEDEDKDKDKDDEEDEDWPEWDAPDRETPDRESRDPLVDALDRRLASVDPMLVDFDDLGLHETVLRLCADLGVTPDWSRWEAGDWTALETPDTPAPAAAPVPPPTVLRPPVLPGLPGSVPRPAGMTPVGRFLAELEAERWRPRLE